MTILHHPSVPTPLADSALARSAARRLHSGRGGRLTVAAGRAWLTRAGDPDDHVLMPGDSLRLAAGEQVVVEPWIPAVPVRLVWRGDQPRGLARRALDAVRALRCAGLRGAAAFLHAAGARLSDWARSAEASASRAHGCMPCGESIASSGALQ